MRLQEIADSLDDDDMQELLTMVGSHAIDVGDGTFALEFADLSPGRQQAVVTFLEQRHRGRHLVS